MTSTGCVGPAPTFLLSFLPAFPPALVLCFLLVVSCGGWGPATASGPRPAGPQRVLAAVPAPYETAPAQDGELTTSPGRAAARRRERRSGTPRLPAPYPADHADLTDLADFAPVPAGPEPQPAADSRARARRHSAHGPDVARALALAPATLQVFRC
ncbi:hypothetical protein [Streptomyces sp. NPDC050600]|uniref:hypothetical protein n=1 Tax=Streptomyces sp. NPDC050600 TaxID=3157213 RepID=UPI00342A1AF5